MILLNMLLNWKTILEILILWFIIYHTMLFFEGSRALQALRGLILLFIAFFIFQRSGLEIINWLFTKVFGISVMAILIIFHPEIRQGLARLGQRHMFSPVLRGEELDLVLREIGKAVDNLCRDKIGALIAIEKNDSLDIYAQSGVNIDGCVSSDLIENIFTPNSLLHDGGMLIQDGRISAAGCLFPLTQKQELSRVFGMRHRAALGLSEETDAIIIAVSEERQNISLVYQEKFYKDLSKEELLFKIKEIIKLKK